MSKVIFSGAILVSALVVLISYILQDTDTDGTIDRMDNCPDMPNFFQLDYDMDKIGDECDLDDDNDGVHDFIDKFDFNSNEWKDSDSDGLGDSRDRDDNNNGISDVFEN